MSEASLHLSQGRLVYPGARPGPVTRWRETVGGTKTAAMHALPQWTHSLGTLILCLHACKSIVTSSLLPSSCVQPPCMADHRLHNEHFWTRGWGVCTNLPVAILAGAPQQQTHSLGALVLCVHTLIPSVSSTGVPRPEENAHPHKTPLGA